MVIFELVNRPREMEKIEKTDKWVPRELNNRQMERCKSACDILLARYKMKSVLQRKVTEEK